MEEQPDLPPSFSPGSYRRPAPRDREQAETRRLVMIVGGIVALLVAVVVARAVMSGHTDTTPSGATPVIGATSAPAKVAPANPGGLQVAGADQDVLAGSGGSGAANGQLAPGPETPAPQQLASAAPVTAPVAAPVTAPAAAPTTAVAPAPTTVVAPQPVAASASAPVSVAPVARMHHRHRSRVEAVPAVAAPAVAGGPEVQFGALASSSEARAEWLRLKDKMPALLRGHEPVISRVSHDGKTLFRLRTGGFATHAAARRFCAEVAAKGGSCVMF